MGTPLRAMSPTAKAGDRIYSARAVIFIIDDDMEQATEHVK
jgi:hypothetical protein